jgi:tight adherence protein C
VITFADVLQRAGREQASFVVATTLVSAGLATYGVAVSKARIATRLGSRGLKRQRAIADGGWFSVLEPFSRWLGSRLSGLLPDGLWHFLDRRLVRSGDYLGVTPEEYVALVIIGALLGAAVGYFHEDTFAYGAASTWVGAALGAYYAQGRFDAQIQKRAREITHGLPYVTDLLALGMTAGLDFPGAIRNVVARSSDRRDALTEELERMLQELGLGHTRRFALEELAERAQLPAVTELVFSVKQAEERGSPIVDVLVIQAEVARQKRSATAEERTSRAQLAMAIPLILILVSTLVILMTPVVLKLIEAFEKFQ